MSESPLKFGVAGLAHGHVFGLIDQLEKEPRAAAAALADNCGLLSEFAGRFHSSYEDWKEMLAKESLDGLIVTDNNLASAEIAAAALEKGIPCLVEKPMAESYPSAKKMLEASKKSGAKLMINWPFQWDIGLHEAKRQLDLGTLGETVHMRFRNGHRGPKDIGCGPAFYGWLYDEKLNGGGAIADFGCYGAVLSVWYFGLPEAVFAIRGKYTKDVPDDHSLIVLKYEKTDVVLEATWATGAWDKAGNPSIHGTHGSLAVFGKTVELNLLDRNQTIELKGSVGSAVSFFIDVLEGKAEVTGMIDPAVACAASRVIDTAKLSAQTGRLEPLIAE